MTEVRINVIDECYDMKQLCTAACINNIMIVQDSIFMCVRFAGKQVGTLKQKVITRKLYSFDQR